MAAYAEEDGRTQGKRGMSHSIYLPYDELQGRGVPNLDVAADYLELRACLSEGRQSYCSDIVDALELHADSEYPDVESEMRSRESVAEDALRRMESRIRALEEAYPFELDPDGMAVNFTGKETNLGEAAYLVSLLLSNLRTMSPLLDGTVFHPSESEERDLRKYFQFVATAAVAAEVGGPAWSFGFPRPDGSGFISKLTEIWRDLRDGTVERDMSSPASPKDDQVDVFAWREQRDGLEGFLLVAAQVATGQDWRNKSIRDHVRRGFPNLWFGRVPATEMIAYNVIPFACADDDFRRIVMRMGNVLHRLRVPRRVLEAVDLARSGVAIEAFEEVVAARDWVDRFLDRARSA